MRQETDQHYMNSAKNFQFGKITKYCFDFKYIIGKGSFGKVTYNIYYIMYFIH